MNINIPYINKKWKTMGNKRRIAWIIWLIIGFSLWVGSLVLMFWTNYQRAINGIDSYFSNPLLMTLGQISSSVFLAMTMALGISFIVKKMTNGK